MHGTYVIPPHKCKSIAESDQLRAQPLYKSCNGKCLFEHCLIKTLKAAPLRVLKGWNVRLAFLMFQLHTFYTYLFCYPSNQSLHHNRDHFLNVGGQKDLLRQRQKTGQITPIPARQRANVKCHIYVHGPRLTYSTHAINAKNVNF